MNIVYRVKDVEAPVPKLTIGDRVRCLGEYDSKDNIVNKLGTVYEIQSPDARDPYITIEFDEYIKGHAGNNYKGKQGYCWCMHASNLELVNKYEVNLI